MKKFMCRNSMLFDFCRILKPATITFILAGMFIFTTPAFAGINKTEGDPEGVVSGWAVSSPESSQPLETYIMACTTPGTPASASVSNIGTTTVTASWGASSCTGCTGNDLTITYYWSVGVSATHTYTSGYTARGTTTSPTLTASVTGLSCGTQYYLRVYASNPCGSSGYRTSSAFTTASVGAVTVSGGGTYCGGTTLLASGGANGTIYWQGTTNGGTSTTTQATSMNVSTSGTYYYRAYNSSCGWGVQGSATVTINPVPSNPAPTQVPVCQGATTTTLNASVSGAAMYWYTGSCGGALVASGTNSITGTIGTTYYVRAKIEATGCWSTGCGTITPSAITAPSNPAPTASVSTICAGSSTNLSASVTGSTIYWYTGSCGGTPTSPASGSPITVSPTSTTTYYARAYDGTCWSVGCGSVTITIPSAPGAVTVSGAGTFCGSTSLSSTGGSGGTIYYQGTTSNGTNTSLGGSPQTVSLPGTNIYYFRARESTCGTWGPQGSATVTINPVPSNPAPTQVAVCQGATTTTLNASVSGAAMYWYTGSCGGALVASGTNSITGTIGTTYYVRAKIEATGCWSTDCGTITPTANANAAISSVTGTSPLCIGATATYATSGVVLGGGTGSWSSSNTAVATVNASTGAVSSVGAGTANITYTITGGCGGTKSASKTLTVTPNANAGSVTAGTTPQCIGGTTTFTVSGVVLGGGSGAWSSSNTAIAMVNASTGVVTAVGAGTCNIVYTVSGGCNGTPTASKPYNVNNQPTGPTLLAKTPNTADVCMGAGASATFNAGSGGVDCGDEYQYTNGGSWSSYTPGTEITASTTGTNVIQIQTRRVCSGNGCDGAGGTWATKAQWTVVADPDVSASGATTICSGLTADLTSSGSNGTGTMSYQWQYYDGATWVNTGTNSNELTTQALAGTTDFRCQYSATGLGCTTATSNTVTVTVSTPEPEGLQLGEDDYVWTGAIDTKWDDADNWISYNGSTFSIPGNVPAVTNDVFFTTYGTTCGTSTPEISSATGNCKDITIESGHELKMLSAQILNVQGNWKNNGTFTAGNGTVTFNGAAQQTVYAGTSNFHNLTINNSSGIEMTSDLTVGNVLNMTLGNIDAKTNDKVLILGTATDNLGTLEYTNGYVLGNMKRWFSNTTNSDTASGLFPLGVGINNRHLLVEYTDASSGGSLTAFFNEASMGWPETWMDIDNVPIIPAAGDCPAFIIMTLSDEGYWDITPSTPSDMTGGKYNISLTGGGIQTINNLCNLTALKREGGGEWYEDGDHVQPTGSTSAPIVKRVGASGWSNWGMGGGAYNPLPINLLSFNAACQNREVTINWTTATETNNDYFTIERSIDAQKWNVLTQIEGAGNSNAIKYYTVRDDNPYDGISYYRLKQTDYNGQYEYFNPVSVRCDSEESTPIISYYPNPFTSEVVIDIHNLSATKASLVIYDLLGNKVYENIFSMVEEINKKFTIDLNRLPVGVYIASFVTDEYSIVSRIVKQF